MLISLVTVDENGREVDDESEKPTASVVTLSSVPRVGEKIYFYSTARDATWIVVEVTYMVTDGNPKLEQQAVSLMIRRSTEQGD